MRGAGEERKAGMVSIPPPFPIYSYYSVYKKKTFTTV